MQQRFTPLNIIAPSAQDISTQSQQAAMEEKTVAELLELDLFDHEGVYFACTVTVVHLSQGQRWWFLSCQLCHRTSIPAGSLYKCSNPDCPSTEAEPKYRISLIGSDGTGEAEFVLFGKIGQQLTQKPLLALLRAE